MKEICIKVQHGFHTYQNNNHANRKMKNGYNVKLYLNIEKKLCYIECICIYINKQT